MSSVRSRTAIFCRRDLASNRDQAPQTGARNLETKEVHRIRCKNQTRKQIQKLPSFVDESRGNGLPDPTRLVQAARMKKL